MNEYFLAGCSILAGAYLVANGCNGGVLLMVFAFFLVAP